jgi:hypothetical protein
MVIAYTEGPFPFVPREDEGAKEEEQTRFMLKNLTREQWDRLMPLLSKSSENPMEFTGPIASKITGFVLAGWENYCDRDGEPVPFTPGDQKANLNKLSAGMRVQIANEAIRRNELTEDDSKN